MMIEGLKPEHIGVAFESGDGDIYSITGTEIDEGSPTEWPQVFEDWIEEMDLRADGIVVFASKDNKIVILTE